MHNTFRFLQRHLLEVTLAVLVLCTAYALHLLRQPFALDDSLRHSAMGALLLRDGFAAYGWDHLLLYGPLATLHVDPWFGADCVYVLLSPLGLLTSLKIFTLLCITSLLVAFTFAMKSLAIPSWQKATFLISLPLLNSIFLLRLFLGRPFTLLIALGILVTVCVLSKKPFLLIPLLAVATWFSQLFVFPLLFAIIGIAWYLVRGDVFLARRATIAVFAGTLLGVFARPFPLDYVRYMIAGFARIPFAHAVQLGGEMQPPVFSEMAIPLLLFVILIFLQVPLWKNSVDWRDARGSPLFYLNVLCIIGFYLFFLWRRGIDVLLPQMLLTIAWTLSIRTQRVVKSSCAMAAIFIFMFVTSVIHAGMMVQELRAEAKDPDMMQSYSESLGVIPPGSRVLNPDWDDFAPAIALRPDLQFVAGIDPTFLYIDSPQGYELMAAPFRVGSVIDLPVWLGSLVSIYPSDVLLLGRERHPTIVKGLEKKLRLPDLAKGKGAFAVYSLKKFLKE